VPVPEAAGGVLAGVDQGRADAASLEQGEDLQVREHRHARQVPPDRAGSAASRP
jgi:hypothetical protein